MNRTFSILTMLLSLSGTVTAQKDYKKDTSFNIDATYEKEVKKYPFIKIAYPQQPKGILKKKDLVYTNTGNRNLHVDVFYPAQKKKNKYPGVLLIHGGGWKSGNKSQNIPLAEQLAANGYIAVTVEYRLSPEARYPAALHDIKAAVRWMRANAASLNLDTAKIAALGVSAGGQLAALLGSTNGMPQFEGKGGHENFSSKVQAIIDIDGILAFKHPESAEGVVAGEWLGGTYEQQPAAWEEASALTHAGKNTPPILFINSSNPRFHAGRNDMIKKLDVYGIYSEVHDLPDTPHPFWLFHPWFEPTVQYTLQFLDKVFSPAQRSSK